MTYTQAADLLLHCRKVEIKVYEIVNADVRPTISGTGIMSEPETNLDKCLMMALQTGVRAVMAYELH